MPLASVAPIKAVVLSHLVADLIVVILDNLSPYIIIIFALLASIVVAGESR